jgi:branched-chain amino acid aminotransferase
MGKPEYAFFKGKIVPIEEAKVSVRTCSLQYGTSVFEGIRGYWNANEQKMFIFKLREHYQRLMRNCKILYITLPYSLDELCRLTLELLKKEKYTQDVYIRPFAYYSDLRISPNLVDKETDFLIYTLPLGEYLELNRGLRVCVSSWLKPSDSALPARAKISGCYVSSALQKTDAVKSGFDEAIVLTPDGHVSEGSAMNLFMVRRGEVITPPVTADILEGITRATLIELFREELKIEVVIRPIDRSELYIADELFFCGTGAQIAAIGSVDHRIIGSGGVGKITKEIQELYFKIVKGDFPKYKKWLTEVSY